MTETPSELTPELAEAMREMFRDAHRQMGYMPYPPSAQDIADYREAKRPKKRKRRIWKRRELRNA